MKLVLTGGHHSSALPLIKQINIDIKEAKLFWFGHKYSMLEDKNTTLEYKEITSLGIPFYNIYAGKFYRTYNIVHLFRIPFGFFQSLYLLLKIRPDVIISFGGYLAVPVVLAGWVLRIPSVTHEQTVVAGYANKFISHFVSLIFVSWKESEKYFPSNKTIYTGIPIRDSIFTSSSNSFSAENDLPYIYVTAGKTGSHLINELIYDTLDRILDICNVILQCGDHSRYSDYERINSKYQTLKNIHPGKLFLRKFVLDNEIGEAYNKADLIVSRSGAHTVAEIIALNKYAILIPISWVSHDEQRKNARLVEEKQLGVMLDETTLTSSQLFTEIQKGLTLPIIHPNNNELRYNVLQQTPAKKMLNEILKLLSY